MNNNGIKSDYKGIDNTRNEDERKIYDKERTDFLNSKDLMSISESNSSDNSPSCSVFESEELDSSVFENDSYERESGVESVDGDWLHRCQTPPLSEYDFDLTEEQALETLKYFTLSVSRANQMTKTTQDLEAVLQLLQEKEKDLELAAHIGQSLLERNRNLYKKTEVLENYVNEVEERETQLQHVVTMKNKLLKTFLEDQDMEDDGYPLSESSPYDSCRDESLLSLTEKCNQLEATNTSLVVEALKLREETDKEEEKETMLVYECIKELTETKDQITHLTDDISQKNQDNIEQQEEISNLINTVLDLQERHNELTEENSELHETLKTSQESQKDLQVEVSTLHEKYQECFDMLIENQREMKVMKEKLDLPRMAGDSDPRGLRQDPRDSLALEIEETVRRDLETSQEKKKHADRVMQTVRAANSKRFPKVIKPGIRPPARSAAQPKKQDKPFDFTFAASVNTSRPKESPSMDDLRAAVRRLSISEGASPGPRGRRVWAPEKLQIVKPMEGSATLHKWQALARPTMSGLHSVHPGVHVKGETSVQSEAPVATETSPGSEHKQDTSTVSQKKAGKATPNFGDKKLEGNKGNLVKDSVKQGDTKLVNNNRATAKVPSDASSASKTLPLVSKVKSSEYVESNTAKTSNLTEIIKSQLSTDNSHMTSGSDGGILLKEILRSTPSLSGSLVTTMPITTTAKTSFVPTTTTSAATTVTAFPRARHVRSRSSENLLNLIKPFNQQGSVQSPSIEIPSAPTSQSLGGFVGRLVRSSSNENLAGTQPSSLPRSSSSGTLSDLIRNSNLRATIGKTSSFDESTINKRASFHLGDSPPSPTQLEVGGFGFFASNTTTKQGSSTSEIPVAASSSNSVFRAFSGLGGFFRPRSKSMDNLGPLPGPNFSAQSPALKKTTRASLVERSLERFNQVFGPD